ncbi:MAG: hypothetical protein QOH12_3762 [Solirubrobacteraceae bacterium]|nr:hypothetical protein [Solirubrobacteraceae bacterium]
MIERLVPDGVVVASTREDLPGVELFDVEKSAVGRAVESRRREFMTGRACARLALERLGVSPVPVPAGERGEPLWPSGVVGSITHCRGYRACAVAKTGDVLGIGIDAEVHAPLPEGVLEHVAFDRELPRLAGQGAGVCLDRVLFSAKEAVYKAWFPLTHRWLGFEDVELTIDRAGGTFHARLLISGPLVNGVRLTELRGRWSVAGDIVATVVVVPA